MEALRYEMPSFSQEVERRKHNERQTEYLKARTTFQNGIAVLLVALATYKQFKVHTTPESCATNMSTSHALALTATTEAALFVIENVIGDPRDQLRFREWVEIGCSYGCH